MIRLFVGLTVFLAIVAIGCGQTPNPVQVDIEVPPQIIEKKVEVPVIKEVIKEVEKIVEVEVSGECEAEEKGELSPLQGLRILVKRPEAKDGYGHSYQIVVQSLQTKILTFSDWARISPGQISGANFFFIFIEDLRIFVQFPETFDGRGIHDVWVVRYRKATDEKVPKEYYWHSTLKCFYFPLTKEENQYLGIEAFLL